MKYSRPLFSVIISTFNAGESLKDTLQSLDKQSFPDFEVIIVDACSEDSTLSCIPFFENLRLTLIKEKDDGIYDAWNKAIRISSGSWLCFLGAGDTFLDDALMIYSTHCLKLANAHYISAQMNVFYSDKRFKKIVGQPWSWDKFRHTMVVAHPGSMHSHKLFKQYGLYDIRFKSAGDYELLLRPKDTLKAFFIPYPLVNFDIGGISSSTNTGLFELIKINQIHRVRPMIFTYLKVAKGILKRFIRAYAWKIRSICR